MTRGIGSQTGEWETGPKEESEDIYLPSLDEGSRSCHMTLLLAFHWPEFGRLATVSYKAGKCPRWLCVKLDTLPAKNKSPYHVCRLVHISSLNVLRAALGHSLLWDVERTQGLGLATVGQRFPPPANDRAGPGARHWGLKGAHEVSLPSNGYPQRRPPVTVPIKPGSPGDPGGKGRDLLSKGRCELSTGTRKRHTFWLRGSTRKMQGAKEQCFTGAARMPGA